MYLPFISSGYSDMTENVFPRYGSDIISYRESPARIVPPPYADAHGTSVPPVPEPSLSVVSESAAVSDCGIREYRVADVFRGQGERLLGSGSLPPRQAKAVFAIMHCRTETYGYHADICDKCGFVGISYNSCRNRHCPRCQGIAKRRWVSDRIGELLPVPYHHVVFTVPSYISMLSLYNQKLIYDLLFCAASRTLLTFGRDPKHLGAEIGFYGILHTWSQTLTPHIHIRFIVTAGGLTEDGTWKEPRHAKKFLFPVRALSKVFRGKFVEGLKDLYHGGCLTIPSDMPELLTPQGFERQLDILVSSPWTVFPKPPFSGPGEVVRYIGRYTHRIAISDSRIISMEDGRVTFSYKDNKEKESDKKQKEMTLATEEFVRRFLYHILPHRYHRIRNYGFLSNGRKKRNIAIIRGQLPEAEKSEIPEDKAEGAVCPICKKGRMTTFLITNGYGQITKYDPAPIPIGYADTS